MTSTDATEGTGRGARAADASAGGGTLHLLPHQGVWGTSRLVIELARHGRMDGGLDEILLTRRALDVDRDFMAAATPVHALGEWDARTARRAQRVGDLAEARGLGCVVAYTAEDLVLGAAAVRGRPGLVLAGLLMEGPAGGASGGTTSSPGFFERRRLRSAARAAVHLACASPSIAARWDALGARTVVRRPGVDLGRYSPGEGARAWREARLPGPDTLLVGSLMRAVPGKRHDVLVEAVRQRNAAGASTALLLIGDGPLHDERRAVRSPDELVFVRKRVNDTPGFFRGIDVLALHADDEEVPMALLEAMAVGCPATVADRGAVAELVGRDAALFTEPGDVGAVVEALDRLGSREERESIGAAGRARVLDQHGLGRLRGELARDRGVLRG
ncbi:MAG: glycosyltransferase [Planctomycetota bacterium]